MGMLNIGSHAPAIALQDTDGHPVDLADHRDEHVLLYLMRSAGCPVCNAHVKDLVGRRDQLAAEGVRVLVALPEDRETATAWKARRRIPFTVVTGRRGTPHEALGLSRKMFGSMQQSGSVLIDRDGIVRHAHAATMPINSYDKRGIAAAISGLAAVRAA
jgi:peroxiredoxin